MQERECFLPAAQVKQRYGVTDMSLWRWLKDESLAFPEPMKIKGRRFWRLADLQAGKMLVLKTVEPPAVDAARRLEVWRRNNKQ